MKRTKDKLKGLTKAVKADLSDLTDEAAKKLKRTAYDIKEEASLRLAEGVSHVRNEGLGNIVSSAVQRAAAATGKAMGYVERVGTAAYKTIVTTTRPAKQTEDGNIAAQATSLYDRIKQDFSRHYDASTISPDKVASQFSEAAKQGAGVLSRFFIKIREGTDKVSRELCKYIPDESDYAVNIGNRSVMISREMLTKPQIQSVRDYMERVREALPQNYRGKSQTLVAIAEQGIRSHKEFRNKAPDVYSSVRKYLRR